MVQHALDAICDQVTGCHTVAFFDLSTQMVLTANSACTLPRDRLNVLCAQAKSCLIGGAEAVIGTDDSFTVFVRSKDDASEALACVCALDIDVHAAVSALLSCFDQMAGGA